MFPVRLGVVANLQYLPWVPAHTVEGPKGLSGLFVDYLRASQNVVRARTKHQKFRGSERAWNISEMVLYRRLQSLLVKQRHHLSGSVQTDDNRKELTLLLGWHFKYKKNLYYF